MAVTEEKSPAASDLEKLPHQESTMYTGDLDPNKYGTLKREYGIPPRLRLVVFGTDFFSG